MLSKVLQNVEPLPHSAHVMAVWAGGNLCLNWSTCIWKVHISVNSADWIKVFPALLLLLFRVFFFFFFDILMISRSHLVVKSRSVLRRRDVWAPSLHLERARFKNIHGLRVLIKSIECLLSDLLDTVQTSLPLEKVENQCALSERKYFPISLFLCMSFWCKDYSVSNLVLFLPHAMHLDIRSV